MGSALTNTNDNSNNNINNDKNNDNDDDNNNTNEKGLLSVTGQKPATLLKTKLATDTSQKTLFRL